MTTQPCDRQDSPSPSLEPSSPVANVLQFPQTEPTFYYFAYGSCMCPVDLKRSLGESTHSFVLGSAILNGYRLGFNRKSVKRNCGVLDIVPDGNATVEGVLYRLPRGGYRRETIEVSCQGRIYHNVRTYVVVEKLAEELAPNDWYFNVVLRGAITCGLSESYCWQLFNQMHQLQQRHWQTQSLRSA